MRAGGQTDETAGVTHSHSCSRLLAGSRALSNFLHRGCSDGQKAETFSRPGRSRPRSGDRATASRHTDRGAAVDRCGAGRCAAEGRRGAERSAAGERWGAATERWGAATQRCAAAAEGGRALSVASKAEPSPTQAAVAAASATGPLVAPAGTAKGSAGCRRQCAMGVAAKDPAGCSAASKGSTTAAAGTAACSEHADVAPAATALVGNAGCRRQCATMGGGEAEDPAGFSIASKGTATATAAAAGNAAAGCGASALDGEGYSLVAAAGSAGAGIAGAAGANARGAAAEDSHGSLGRPGDHEPFSRGAAATCCASAANCGGCVACKARSVGRDWRLDPRPGERMVVAPASARTLVRARAGAGSGLPVRPVPELALVARKGKGAFFCGIADSRPSASRPLAPAAPQAPGAQALVLGAGSGLPTGSAGPRARAGGAERQSRWRLQK